MGTARDPTRNRDAERATVGGYGRETKPSLMAPAPARAVAPTRPAAAPRTCRSTRNRVGAAGTDARRHRMAVRKTGSTEDSGSRLSNGAAVTALRGLGRRRGVARHAAHGSRFPFIPFHASLI